MKDVLHIGCGGQGVPEDLFPKELWRESRLDINPEMVPDFCCSMVDMGCIPDEMVDAVYSSHNLEHLEGSQVPVALKEIHRVLKPGGRLTAIVPDFSAVALFALEKGLDAGMYAISSGVLTDRSGNSIPVAEYITPLQALFGHERSIKEGNSWMSHRTAFTRERMVRALFRAGFDNILVNPQYPYALHSTAQKPKKEVSNG